MFPPCHILPPSEIPWRLFLAVLQAQKGYIYFTEVAERVEYGNYGLPDEVRTNGVRTEVCIYIYIYIYIHIIYIYIYIYICVAIPHSQCSWENVATCGKLWQHVATCAHSKQHMSKHMGFVAMLRKKVSSLVADKWRQH